MGNIVTATVSVVIPTLNEGGTIEACLDSVGVNDGVEVVVSDGGSRDDTLPLVEERHDDILVTKGSAGRGQQLNRGASIASGRHLLFLHADCRLPLGWLSALQEALDDPKTALACFQLRTVPSNHRGSTRWRRHWLRLLDLRSLGLGLPYGDQGFGIRREVFDRVGGFPDIPLMEDVEMARACRRIGRFERIRLEMRTSARRFEKHPIKTRLMTATFPLMFRLGVSPWKLASWYRGER